MTGVLGIDTSCYTTSLAFVQADGKLIQARRLLDVPMGETGLSQSRGVYAHLRQFNDLLAEILNQTGIPEAVAVSVRPRPVENSYMPVFTVGEQFARALSAAWKCPLFCTSHQEGHLMAGLSSAGGPDGDEFLALHCSGGTTEFLRVCRRDGGMEIHLLGGSEDLHAGQFVDRTGVALGLEFPAGPSLERLARDGFMAPDERRAALHARASGISSSFSGPAAQARRLIEQGVSPERIAAMVYDCLARTIHKCIERAIGRTGIDRMLMVGGVMSSMLLRDLLAERIKKRRTPVRLYYADPSLSSDNAAGVALIGLNFMQNGRMSR